MCQILVNSHSFYRDKMRLKREIKWHLIWFEYQSAKMRFKSGPGKLRLMIRRLVIHSINTSMNLQKSCIDFSINATPLERYMPEERVGVRYRLWRIVESTPFEYFIMTLIVFNTILLMMKVRSDIRRCSAPPAKMTLCFLAVPRSSVAPHRHPKLHEPYLHHVFHL